MLHFHQVNMGRVRRYKKYKACDPFSSNNGGEASFDNNRKNSGSCDEPPELFDERSKKKKRRKEWDWENEDERDLMIQRDAMREIQHNKTNTTKNMKKIEGKRENETMKQFKRRLRQETRITLKEEVKKLSSTAQKRKLRLKERKLKREGKSKPKPSEEPEFASHENNMEQHESSDMKVTQIRKSTESNTATLDYVRERVDNPPDLTIFKLQMKIPMKKVSNDFKSSSVVVVDASDEEVMSLESKKDKKRRFEDIISSNSLDEESSFVVDTFKSSSSSMKTISSMKSNANKKAHSNNNREEMELLRSKVQEAYREIKRKRSSA